ncbi:MAG: 50S ribosomal protein L30 [Clostridia bacterium]|nr:50S ribosomal protein L30 [Clostridia bacterium]MDE6356555.1 50S ribosomal protein L30 [Clostridia bacterium]MDE7214570.1 50S ribosomal protein L30 [Clostridia bacterium]
MVKVTLVKSLNGQIKTVKDTVAALGLKKIRQSRTLEETPANMGQLKKVAHLVKVEQV